MMAKTKIVEWINKIHQGDALEVLRKMPANIVDCCVTSPPYWGLRDYGTATWEGGDEKCDHKIPDVELDPMRGKKEERSSHIIRFNRTSCYKCGAIRIDEQLGLESEKNNETYGHSLAQSWRQLCR